MVVYLREVYVRVVYLRVVHMRVVVHLRMVHPREVYLRVVHLRLRVVHVVTEEWFLPERGLWRTFRPCWAEICILRDALWSECELWVFRWRVHLSDREYYPSVTTVRPSSAASPSLPLLSTVIKRQSRDERTRCQFPGPTVTRKSQLIFCVRLRLLKQLLSEFWHKPKNISNFYDIW